jgi:putative membrane protein
MRAVRGACLRPSTRSPSILPSHVRIVSIAAAPLSSRASRPSFRRSTLQPFPTLALAAFPRAVHTPAAAAAPGGPPPPLPDAAPIGRWARFKQWLKEDHNIDEAAEIRRLDQRVVFDSDRWRKHRNVTRFVRAIPIPMSAVMLQTLRPVTIVTLWTVIICAAQVMMDAWFFHLPISLMSLSGPTLGLLLVFRTNASYERWDGARKMIGLVKNRSEDLVRQASIWFPSDRPDLKQQMLRYVQAFFFALKVHLRSGKGGLEDDKTLIADLTPILEPQELQQVLQATNRPAHILQCITLIMGSADLDTGRVMAMDQNLTTLSDVLGGCERILRTPIPLSYTKMTTRFLLLWLILLPLSLSWEIVQLGCTIWLTPPCIIFLAFLLLGIDEVAVQVEEPFTILPLETYAEGSRKNTGNLYLQMHAAQAVLFQNTVADPSPQSSSN